MSVMTVHVLIKFNMYKFKTDQNKLNFYPYKTNNKIKFQIAL